MELVDTAERENRRELVLSGPDVTQYIEKRGLPDRLFRLKSLNFLEVSKTPLKTLPATLSNLSNLTSLVLCGNKLEALPVALGSLSKLRLLDLSGNILGSLQEDIGSLSELQTLNISCNNLDDVPNMGGLVQLHVLDASHNNLTNLPEGIPGTQLGLLAELLVHGNKIDMLPPELAELPSLKILDVSDNALTVIPPEMSECLKLKEFRYGGNKLKDRRLAKMMGQCSTKAVLDYLRGILEKERQQGGGKGKGKKKRKGGKSISEDDVNDVAKNLMKVLRFNDDKGLTIEATENAIRVRPYLVCCVVRNLNMLKSKNMFKRFITLQTKLHEGICKKRQAATIATHDLRAVKAPLKYDAKPPKQISLTPLGKAKSVTSDRLVASLRREAEELRKEKKRSTVSGVHKYLDLLRGLDVFPCLLDAENQVLSFPPITNSEASKVTKETTDIMVEVTSSSSLEVCKQAMDQLLHALLEMGIGCEEAPQGAAPPPLGIAAAIAAAQAESDEDEDDDPEVSGEGLVQASGQTLVVEQVKVIDQGGALRVVYPSRLDLKSEAFKLSAE